MDLFGAASKVSDLVGRSDDDFADRLNHRYSAILLIIFAVVTTTNQYVGDQINCWVPAHFTGNWKDYTNKICWVSNTYYLPMEDSNIPQPGEPRAELGYYQWVPIMLLLQALLFYCPCLIWRLLNDRSGIDVNNVVDAALTAHNAMHSETRDKTVKYIARHYDRYLGNRKKLGGNKFMKVVKLCLTKVMCGRRYGNYLTFLYLVVKVFYMANAIGQLFLLNAFIGDGYSVYGFDVMHDLATGTDWRASRRFPRVTMCAFTVRRLGSNHNYNVQCVLPINLFNEKIYIFIWFWLVFVSIISIFSFCSWLYRSIFKSDRLKYVRRHLKYAGKIKREADKTVSHKFSEDYLRQDGVFVMRLIAKNTNDLISTEIVGALWDQFKDKPLSEQKGDDDDY